MTACRRLTVTNITPSRSMGWRIAGGRRIDCSSLGLCVERGDDQYFLILPFMTIPVPSTFPSWIQSIPLALVPI